MKQSRMGSLVEQILNTGSGFLLGLVCQWVFLPWLGVALDARQNLIFALIMTVVSVCRGYLWRRLMEFLHVRIPLTPALIAIAAERDRQIRVEGWSHDHDDNYIVGELERAAACYAIGGGGGPLGDQAVGMLWPWAAQFWKPREPRRNLVRAGALLLAALEKHDRAARKRHAPIAIRGGYQPRPADPHALPLKPPTSGSGVIEPRAATARIADPIGQFLAELTHERAGARTSAEALFAAFEKWSGDKPFARAVRSRSAFNHAIAERGFRLVRARRKGAGSSWLGLYLLTSGGAS